MAVRHLNAAAIEMSVSAPRRGAATFARFAGGAIGLLVVVVPVVAGMFTAALVFAYEPLSGWHWALRIPLAIAVGGVGAWVVSALSMVATVILLARSD